MEPELVSQIVQTFAEEMRKVHIASIQAISESSQRAMAVMESALHAVKDSQRVGGVPVDVARLEAQAKAVQASAQKAANDARREVRTAGQVIDPRVLEYQQRQAAYAEFMRRQAEAQRQPQPSSPWSGPQFGQ